MDIPILFEDESIVIVDKPSGLVVNRSETTKGDTLQDWIGPKLGIACNISYPNLEELKQRPSKYRGTSEELTDEDTRYFEERLGMVHRLDKETSGVMVFAKSPKAFVELLSQFRDRLIHKEYMALTHGIWDVLEGEINLPIGRRYDDRKKMGIREDGRESVTKYVVVNQYRNCVFPKELKVETKGYQGFALVRFIPLTGRTHQIRVHARALMHPLVGDLQYGGRKRSREDRKWCDRLMLQAQTLSLLHPVTNERMIFECKQSMGGWEEWLS
ncbi:MAG: RluA family pseudouridine synthase [bacterium]